MKMNNNDIENRFEEDKSPVDARILLDLGKCQSVGNLTLNDLPDTPGLYSIHIQNFDILPTKLGTELRRQDDTLLYIGKTTKSLRKRLWEEELHAQRPATFFRTIGAVLGFRPPKSSLAGKSNQCNYRFSSDDNAKIIQWIEDNLLVNFIECTNNINYIEKHLIQEAKPLMNIQNNPKPFEFVIKSRKECRDRARS